MLTIIKRTDNYDSIKYQCENEDGTKVDLSGAFVNFVMGKKNKLVTNAPAVVTSAVDGQVEYQLTDADTLVSGTYLGEFVVTFPSGQRKTFPSNGYITVTIEANLDVNQVNVVLDMVAAKQGEFDAKLDSILAQMSSGSGISMSAMNEWDWIATEGQLTYTVPSTANLTTNSKWLDVHVGGIPLDPDLVSIPSTNQLTLLITPDNIPAGVKVMARWTEPMVPSTAGHHSTHELGGQDEIDITTLRNYDTVLYRAQSVWMDVKKDFGAKGDGTTDDTTAIQNALNYANTNGSVRLYFPEGTYIKNSSVPLRIYKNTFVFMHTNAIIKRMGTYNKVFMNGANGNSSYATGYNGDGNIHFLGGTIDLNQSTLSATTTLSAFDLGHGENITFEDMTIKNGQIGHYFQVTGCKRVSFRRCTFRDQVYTGTGTSYAYEVIQMEPMVTGAFPSFGSYDNTITTDVTIENCNFINVIRACGTHSFVSKVTTTGSITNGSTSLTVADATLFNIGEAIQVNGADLNGADLSTTISNKVGSVLTLGTTAKTTVSNADVSNATDINIPKQYCTNIRIENNTIDTTTDVGINLMGYSNVSVINNTILNAGGFAIGMNGVNDSDFLANVSLNIQKSGLNVSYSNGNRFSNNLYKEVALKPLSSYAGIRVTDSDNNTWDNDTVYSVAPNYTYAWYSSNGSVGNKIISHRFTKGGTATISGSDATEMSNYQIGAGQDVLFDGDLATNAAVGTLLHDIRNYNFLIIMGNDNSSATAQMISMVLPKSAIIIGTTSRFRLICDDSNANDRVDFSFPTGTQIQADAITGTCHIRKVIGVV